MRNELIIVCIVPKASWRVTVRIKINPSSKSVGMRT